MITFCFYLFFVPSLLELGFYILSCLLFSSLPQWIALIWISPDLSHSSFTLYLQLALISPVSIYAYGGPIPISTLNLDSKSGLWMWSTVWRDNFFLPGLGASYLSVICVSDLLSVQLPAFLLQLPYICLPVLTAYHTDNSKTGIDSIFYSWNALCFKIGL